GDVVVGRSVRARHVTGAARRDVSWAVRATADAGPRGVRGGFESGDADDPPSGAADHDLDAGGTARTSRLDDDACLPRAGVVTAATRSIVARAAANGSAVIAATQPLSQRSYCAQSESITLRCYSSDAVCTPPHLPY